MEDDDRIRAIECIARHQSELEQTQTQLSTLLESAIVYLQNLRPDQQIEDIVESILETPEPTRAEQRVKEIRQKVMEEFEQLPILGDGSTPPVPPERKVFPFASHQPPKSASPIVGRPVPIPVPVPSHPVSLNTVTTQRYHSVLFVSCFTSLSLSSVCMTSLMSSTHYASQHPLLLPLFPSKEFPPPQNQQQKTRGTFWHLGSDK